MTFTRTTVCPFALEPTLSPVRSTRKVPAAPPRRVVEAERSRTTDDQRSAAADREFMK